MINNYLNKFYYLLMLISLNTGYVVVSFLTRIAFLLPRKQKGDVILFPYAQKGSDGYTRRFEEYLPFFEKDNISYYMCDVVSNDFFIKHRFGTFRQQYYLHRLVFWKRLAQVLKARHYKSAFVHRSLFPFYPDQKGIVLEKLLKALNKNVVYDYWDSVWLQQPEVIEQCAKIANKITVTNDFLKEYFLQHNSKVYFLNLGINTVKYKQKTDYSIHSVVRFIYTGLPDNVEVFLDMVSPYLIELSKEMQFELIIISRARIYVEGLAITYYDFDEDTFFDYLHSADIGLYVVPETDVIKGKMAMKVLDYLATGLPIIATPCGITPHAKNNENIILLEKHENLIDTIKQLANNEPLMKTIGKNGIKLIEEHHSINNSYEALKHILFE